MLKVSFVVFIPLTTCSSLILIWNEDGVSIDAILGFSYKYIKIYLINYYFLFLPLAPEDPKLIPWALASSYTLIKSSTMGSL